MIGISSGKYAFPKKVYSVDDWCDFAQQPPQMAQDLKDNGIESCYFGNFDEVFELSIDVITDLIEDSPVSVEDIDVLILCHTSQLSVLHQPMNSISEIAVRTGLEKAFKFSVAQQYCASPSHALKVVQSLFSKNRHWNHAVLVIMDAVQVEDLRPINNFGLHSDGAAALLVSRSELTNNKIISLETYNDYSPLTLSEDNLYEQSANYVWAKISLIRKVMKSAGIKGSNISTVLPHNVNKDMWLKTLNALKIPEEKLFDGNFSNVGHVFGADFAINLLDAGILNIPGKHIGFSTGVGGCIGAFILDVNS